MSLPTRTIEVWESQYDAQRLADSNYYLQVAKAMLSGDDATPKYNVIWRSEVVATSTKITWAPKYGVNWTKNIPKTAGASIVVESKWTACEQGAVLDIDQYGFFAPSSAKGVPGFLSIGSNNYMPHGGGGVFVIIGIQDLTGEWMPIYYEFAELFHGYSGKWQPHEVT